MTREENYYYREIENIPLLTLEEERSLGEKAFKGDKDAQNKLVAGNLRFVITIASKYVGLGLDFDDLVNEGNIGLMHAATKFNPERKIRFTTYAMWWIRERIQKAIRETGKGVRFPANRYKEMSDPKWTFASLDKDFNINDEDSSNLGTLLKDERELSPEEKWYRNGLQDCMWDFIETLPENQRLVLIKRFGLDGENCMSLNEIGISMGLTKERVRQLEKKAKQSLENAYFNFSSYIAA